jgi:hypothetical protein
MVSIYVVLSCALSVITVAGGLYVNTNRLRRGTAYTVLALCIDIIAMIMIAWGVMLTRDMDYCSVSVFNASLGMWPINWLFLIMLMNVWGKLEYTPPYVTQAQAEFHLAQAGSSRAKHRGRTSESV